VVLGLSVCFAPVNVAAYLYTPLELRGAAVGLLSLLRNEGGSVGTSVAQTFQERREQFHGLRLGGIPRSLQRGRELLRRACSGVLLPRDRRSGRSTAARFAGTRKSAAAASICACLLRLLLDVCGVDLCARIRGSDHEAISG
jgi:hypothetical protein